MRAAVAAKEHSDACSNLFEHVGELISDGSGTTAISYLTQSAMPFLKAVLAALCEEKPGDPSGFVTLWLMQRVGVPSTLVNEVRNWYENQGILVGKVDTRASIVSTGSCLKKAKMEPVAPSVPRDRGHGMRVKKTTSILFESEGASKNNSRRCACGNIYLEDSIFCRKCGAKRETTEGEKCECGRTFMGENLFCRHCNRPRASAVPHFQGGGLDKSDGDSTPSSRQAARRKSVFWGGSQPSAVDTVEEEDTEDSLFKLEDLFKEAETKDEDKSDVEEDGERGQKKRGSVVPVAGKGFGGLRRKFTQFVTSAPAPVPPMDELKAILRGVPAFESMPEVDLEKVAGIVKCSTYQSDEDLVMCGSEMTALHVVVDGGGIVSVPKQVGMVQRGHCFGEDALRRIGACHTMQVTARGALTTISINAEEYHKLDVKKVNMNRDDEIRRIRNRGNALGDDDKGQLAGKKTGICACSGLRIQDTHDKTLKDKDLIKASVQANKVLGDVLTLSEEQLGMIANAVYLVGLPEGKALLKKGWRCPGLYILQEGCLNASTEDHCADHKIFVGESFGELGLVHDAPETATITALIPCKLWVLPRQEFRLTLRLTIGHRLEEYACLLGKIPTIRNAVDTSNMDIVADIVEEISFLEGELVCAEGEDEGMLYVCSEGSCEVSKDGQMLRMLEKGDWIGEDQIMQKIPAAVTVKVTSDTAVILALDAPSLAAAKSALASMEKASPQLTSEKLAEDSSLGNLKDFKHIDHLDKQHLADKFLEKRMGRRSFQRRGSGKTEAMDISNCKKIGILGQGAFGLVALIEDETTGKMYALKGMSKEHILRENLVKMVKNERATMMLLNSDFIVHLHKTYQDSKFIYLALEPALGGDMFDVYSDGNLWGNISHTKFYVANITLGLQHMHQQRVIWRDLKLENLLMSTNGYCKLTDFGISKMVIGKTYTVCGTADYFAPETLRQQGHNRGADWWALGVLIFIMMAGRSPFDAPCVSQIYKNIIKGFSAVKFPDTFPSDLTDVIKSLCRKKPEERVAMQKGGANNLKEMPFFSSFKWNDMAKQVMEPPYYPKGMDTEALRRKEDSMDINFDDLEEWDGGMYENNWHDYKSTKRNAQVFTAEDQKTLIEDLVQ